MKFKMTGSHGFIGNALYLELLRNGHAPAEHNVDYYFFFGSPSSNILFNENFNCIRETITAFMDACEYCKRHDVKLIYPSSSTVYHLASSYAHTKNSLEAIVKAYDIKSMGFRIFTGYGPGEWHKGRIASPIYQFARAMVNHTAPIIYGDGTQTRDFVFIDDIVKTILANIDRNGVMDIGTGVSVSFNEIVTMINSQLHTHRQPIYIKTPGGYIQDMKCEYPLYESTAIYEGIEKTIRGVYENR